MNIYDFDGTLYAGDSTFDFLTYLFKKQPALLRFLPSIAGTFCSYRLGNTSKTVFKEKMYGIFAYVEDVPGEVEQFWKEHRKKLKKWYAATARPDDLVISASPEFLVIPGCALLKIQAVMASRVDPKTGKYTGENCHGAEKIRRLRESYPGVKPEMFYSDSHADDPLALLAREAYMVKGEKLTPWKFQ